MVTDAPQFAVGFRLRVRLGGPESLPNPPDYLIFMERVMGIEPTSSAWEAEVLPLNNTRVQGASIGSPHRL